MKNSELINNKEVEKERETFTREVTTEIERTINAFLIEVGLKPMLVGFTRTYD